MADFGKLNFSTSFKPTSAFPLDARCYFEGDNAYAQAAAAAASAGEVGSTNTIYHYGMKLLVNVGGIYTWYQISTSGGLIAEGTGGTGTGTGSDGVGISKIEKTSTSGLVDTYTITLTSGNTYTFTVTNGKDGTTFTPSVSESGTLSWTNDKGLANPTSRNIKGADGVGISSIAKTGVDGLVDTYTITLTNGNTSTFTVTNGNTTIIDNTGDSFDINDVVELVLARLTGAEEVSF